MNITSFTPSQNASTAQTSSRDTTGGKSLPIGLGLALGLTVSCLATGLSTAVLAAEGSRTVDEEKAVSGRVLGEKRPISEAEVYAYEVASFALEKVRTDKKGAFLFEELPAGLYKIIAHKRGFLPTVELLLRRRADAPQFVELELAEEDLGDVRQAESYWDARARIPPDVLRHIQHIALAQGEPEAALTVHDGALREGRVVAEGGSSQLQDGNARMIGAKAEVESTVAGMRMELEGHMSQLSADGASTLPDGEVQSLAMAMAGKNHNELSLLAANGAIANLRGGELHPVDLEHYRLSWSGATAGGHSRISARYLDETQYASGFMHPADAITASRSWDISGSHRRELAGHTSVTTGIAYRERQGNSGDSGAIGSRSLDDQAVDVYGLADSRILPRILVEYGLYSSLREGGMTLMPQGGLVVDLGSDWKVRTSLARRVEQSEENEEIYRRFVQTAFYGDGEECQQAGEACYEVTFAHENENDESFSLGAIHREYAETLRVYFSEDFFDRLESLLMVPGDELPELRFRMVRRISPKILARLESNFATGGGGIFYATDDLAYENRVRYLVTSLDTRFQNTATGVFVAFHHLEQALDPLDSDRGERGSDLEVQSLQLMLTQDLSALANFSSRWAVRLNMELSRGATPYSLTPDDDLRKKLTGGISLSF